MTEDVTEIIVKLHSAPGCVDNTYKLTVIKNKDALISDVKATEKGYEFKVAINKDKAETFETAKMVVALYDENGKFVGLEVAEISASDTTKTVQVEAEGVPVTAKVMLWDTLDSLNPLCVYSKMDIN